MSLAPPEESAVCDFATALLACGYARSRRVLQTRGGIPFLICGKNKQTKADVCILATMKLFINNTSKKTTPMVSPGWLRPRTSTYRRSACRPGFTANNELRERTLGLLPCQFKTTMPILLVITLKATSVACLLQNFSFHDSRYCCTEGGITLNKRQSFVPTVLQPRPCYAHRVV